MTVTVTLELSDNVLIQALRQVSPARRQQVLRQLENETLPAVRVVPATELDKWTGLSLWAEMRWKTASGCLSDRIVLDTVDCRFCFDDPHLWQLPWMQSISQGCRDAGDAVKSCSFRRSEGAC